MNFVCVILVFCGSISLTLSVLYWCFMGVYLYLCQCYTGVLWEYIFNFVCVILVFCGCISLNLSVLNWGFKGVYL